ncbi:hypothetical protein [Hoyosella altamirensis]|uniref:Uncharacterized protein n=1 Tax=Hoyosella altamirensis TaxID=616997 RepID=A0A839RPZ8_9ACTN|nr:hypothetical protein [Hoyosella altamirensis]MBB3039072.1 hypothetical protein [Hoyosella altamirensis]
MDIETIIALIEATGGFGDIGALFSGIADFLTAGTGSLESLGGLGAEAPEADAATAAAE